MPGREEVLVLGLQGPGRGFACGGWSQGRDSIRALQMPALDSPGPVGLKGAEEKSQSVVRSAAQAPHSPQQKWGALLDLLGTGRVTQ